MADPANKTLALSDREIAILVGAGRGETSREIADRLAYTPGYIDLFASQLYKKLGARNRTQAVVVALKMGLIELREL